MLKLKTLFNFICSEFDDYTSFVPQFRGNMHEEPYNQLRLGVSESEINFFDSSVKMAQFLVLLLALRLLIYVIIRKLINLYLHETSTSRNYFGILTNFRFLSQVPVVHLLLFYIWWSLASKYVASFVNQKNVVFKSNSAAFVRLIAHVQLSTYFILLTTYIPKFSRQAFDYVEFQSAHPIIHFYMSNILTISQTICFGLTFIGSSLIFIIGSTQSTNWSVSLVLGCASFELIRHFVITAEGYTHSNKEKEYHWILIKYKNQETPSKEFIRFNHFLTPSLFLDSVYRFNNSSLDEESEHLISAGNESSKIVRFLLKQKGCQFYEFISTINTDTKLSDFLMNDIQHIIKKAVDLNPYIELKMLAPDASESLGGRHKQGTANRTSLFQNLKSEKENCDRCFVCLKKDPEGLFLPCMHSDCCLSCSCILFQKMIQSCVFPKCPLCRRNVYGLAVLEQSYNFKLMNLISSEANQYVRKSIKVGRLCLAIKSVSPE